MARLLIVEARFYAHLNDLLLAGTRAAIEAAGHEHETVTVPGALEIPAAVALAAESGRYDGYVALGVVIRGETYHFEIVAGESARGLMALTLDGLAIGNGILTVEDEAQAIEVANNTKFGLGASIWTQNLDKAERYSRAVHAGIVTVNNVVISDPRVPFGGVKNSGFGRELSRYGILEFVNTKSVRFYDQLSRHHYVE